MQAAMRPYAIAGAALLGASVIIVKPLAPQPDPEQGLQQISDAAVRLADADVTLADLTTPDTPWCCPPARTSPCTSSRRAY